MASGSRKALVSSATVQRCDGDASSSTRVVGGRGEIGARAVVSILGALYLRRCLPRMGGRVSWTAVRRGFAHPLLSLAGAVGHGPSVQPGRRVVARRIPRV